MNRLDEKNQSVRREMKEQKPVVLVVEDYEPLIPMIHLYLNGMGLEEDSLWAKNLKELRNIIEEATDINVVILDHKLPEGDSMELGHLIKKKFPRCKLIATSGDSSYEQMLNGGCHYEMAKVFTLEQFERTVQKALKESLSLRECASVP